MSSSANNVLSWVKGHYDKIIAFLVLFFLIGSLLYLAVSIGAMHSDRQKFEQEIGSYKPKHPNVIPVDTKVFGDIMESIEKPLQLSYSGWTNRMLFVPDLRVWCVDCRKPIPFASAKCSFCNAVNPDPANDPLRDGDKDGLPDAWEKKYGLNPMDAKDAELDLDKDGFSNIEEFMVDPKTDPADPQSHPPITAKLRLEDIVPDPFKFRFKSVVTLPDKSLNFGLNLNVFKQVPGTTNRVAQIKTHFAKIGQEIKGEGFTLVKYEPKMEKRKIQGVGERDVDVSVLTLQRGDKLIPLVKDQDVQWDEFTAKMLFTLDNTNIVVKIGNVFSLKNEQFKVINIDNKNQSVLLEAVKDGFKVTIGKFPETIKEGAGETKQPAEKQGESPL